MAPAPEPTTTRRPATWSLDEVGTCGVRAVIELPSAATETTVAWYAVPPMTKLTTSGCVNPWPLITTWSPPWGLPRFGRTEVMASCEGLTPREMDDRRSRTCSARWRSPCRRRRTSRTIADAMATPPPLVVAKPCCTAAVCEKEALPVAVNVTRVPSGAAAPPTVTMATAVIASLIPATLGLTVREMPYVDGVGCLGAVGLLCEQPTRVTAVPSARPTRIRFRFMVVSRISNLNSWASRRRS